MDTLAFRDHSTIDSSPTCWALSNLRVFQEHLKIEMQFVGWLTASHHWRQCGGLRCTDRDWRALLTDNNSTFMHCEIFAKLKNGWIWFHCKVCVCVWTSGISRLTRIMNRECIAFRKGKYVGGRDEPQVRTTIWTCICVATQCKMAQQMNPHVRLKSCLYLLVVRLQSIFLLQCITQHNKKDMKTAYKLDLLQSRHSSFSECTAGIPGGSRKGNINNVLTTE